jgi:hypothetical protein
MAEDAEKIPARIRLAPEKDANVRLARTMSPITVPNEDHDGEVNIGLDITLKLPSEEQQRAGFHVENPTALVTQYPGRYKRFQPKARRSETGQKKGGEA